uniref:Uncharacterized protein n=1 Tax=virus sp. ctBM815 TaxID=2825806 RepID=A0A8S5RK55_9VIRU|nr:MAG TPA: hypothetical protein [virus sp. ctBM815]
MYEITTLAKARIYLELKYPLGLCSIELIFLKNRFSRMSRLVKMWNQLILLTQQPSVHLS